MNAALTIRLAMNIPNKPALYAEAFRVLRPGGRFVVYDVLQGEGGNVRISRAVGLGLVDGFSSRAH